MIDSGKRFAVLFVAACVVCTAFTGVPHLLSDGTAGFDRAAFETPDNVFSPSFFWLWNGRLAP